MLAKIAAFELRYQLRQPLFFVVFTAFFLLTFGSVTIDQIQIGSGGSVHKNSPFAIAQTHQIWTLFFMFVSAAFVANIVVRDDETGFGPIIRSTAVRKADYLYGRFLGAYAAAMLAFASVPIAIFVGSLMPWVDHETLGPNRLGDYAYAYVLLAAPGVFLTSALFFALTTVTRSMMATYLGAVGFLVAYGTLGVLSRRPGMDTLPALLEPFGLAAFGQATRYWTAAERNTLMPPFEGLLLANRLIWLGVSLLAAAAAFPLFSFRQPAKAPKRERRRRRVEAAAEAPAAPVAVRAAALPRFDRRTTLAQLAARTRLDMAQVFRSPAFLVLIALGLLNAFVALWTYNTTYDGAVHPVTRIQVGVLEGAFGLIPILIAIYYAGELVWRERERRTHEIIDATPTPDWMFVLPKALAISLVLVTTLLISVAAGVLVQLAKGYTGPQLDKYLLWYVLPSAVDWTLLAILAVFLQVVAPHKFVGWGLMVLFMVSQLTFGNIGWEHNLYQYGGTPGTPLSDMNGAGRFWIGAAWFRLYWALFATVLLVLSYAWWRRGAEQRLRPRLARTGRRLRGPAGVIFAAALAGFAAVGGWIYYNTNVLNPYRTRQDTQRWQADYEKTLLPFERTPQPKIVSVRLNVDLKPRQGKAVTRGAYVVENRTGAPLREVHVRFDRDLQVDALTVEGGRATRTYAPFNYRIFTFDTPMRPGERRSIVFGSTRWKRGFPNEGMDTRVVDNGTFLNNDEVAPRLGMDREGLLQDRSVRRKFGLPAQLRPPVLLDQGALAVNLIRHDSDWAVSDITLTTDADQIPIAPGTKVSDQTRDGRRTARFLATSPILNFFSLQSAAYAVKTAERGGVALAVYHHPGHAWNVYRMLRSMGNTLDFAQGAFGPFQFRQLRIQEFPAYADFAQSFAGAIPYSENLGFVADYRDPAKIDLATYVTAHEVGHQWWGHQVVASDQQGATALIETLAQYTALMVMERTYGPDQIRKFLKFELDSYLRSRGGEAVEEVPLFRVENQPYIHYRKGSLVMYRLKDELGEAAVNRALRALVRDFGLKAAPYPTTLDLLARLRAEAPADKQALITDLFERITLYDLKTRKAEAVRRPDGRYDLTLTVEASKAYADGKGVERKARLAEVFDVGAFTETPEDKSFGPAKVLRLEKRPVRSGAQTLTLVVDKPPRFAGVDPYNKAIDRNSNDNVVKVDVR